MNIFQSTYLDKVCNSLGRNTTLNVLCNTLGLCISTSIFSKIISGNNLYVTCHKNIFLIN